MTRSKLKAIEKAIHEKTGRGFDYPFVLMQLSNGEWYNFDDVGRKDTAELEPLDPRIRHGKGNHYLFAGGIDNTELIQWIQKHPEITAQGRLTGASII